MGLYQFLSVTSHFRVHALGRVPAHLFGEFVEVALGLERPVLDAPGGLFLELLLHLLDLLLKGGGRGWVCVGEGSGGLWVGGVGGFLFDLLLEG